MAERLKVLAIAVATGRIGYVFMIGGELRDWGLSRKASKSPKHAAKQAKSWIDHLKPDVVVTEKTDDSSRKGEKTKLLIDAITNVTADAFLLDVAVTRIKLFKDKYTEAKALAEQFPELKAWLPKKPRIWEPEPRNTTYFEALSLALQVQPEPPAFIQ